MDLHRILNNDDHEMEDAEMHEEPAQPQSSKLRVGKWGEEEEQYAAALIKHFVAGALSIPTGTSLRSFLANKLHCSAMRVSTKLSMDTLGTMVIPKKLGQKRFFPMEGLSQGHRQRVAEELRYLETVFRQKENVVGQITDDTYETSSPRSESGHYNATTGDGQSTTSDEDTEGHLRIGSWSVEEQEYAAALIDAFLDGVVSTAEGTSLRSFLAERLCCNPMRVSKKLATGKMASMVIPKRLGSATFRRRNGSEFGEISRREHSLEQLRVTCFSTTERSVEHPFDSQLYHSTVPYGNSEPLRRDGLKGFPYITSDTARDEFRAPLYSRDSPLARFSSV